MYRKALKLKKKLSLTQSSLYPNTSSVHFYFEIFATQQDRGEMH